MAIGPVPRPPLLQFECYQIVWCNPIPSQWGGDFKGGGGSTVKRPPQQLEFEPAHWKGCSRGLTESTLTLYPK